MKRLLLVEADERVQRELAQHLRSIGHEIIEVDEQRALELCTERVEAVLVWPAREPARADAETPSPPALVGETTTMRDLRATLRLLSNRPRTHVLVGGEPGSGKHTVARALHQATQLAQDFVLLNAERLAKLAETGLRAWRNGATLYLPAIEQVDRALQRRLAELLADQDVYGAPPVRLVVGAMRSGQQLSLGRLVQRAVHPELAARIPVLLDVIPLRKRKSDIPLLVSHLLESSSRSSGLPCAHVTPAALEHLTQHTWPGNVRELANVLERAALAGQTRIDVSELPSFAEDRAEVDYELPSSGIDMSEFERAMLVQALGLSRGNQTQAASLLGLTRDQIRYRMSKFKIPRSSSES